MLKEKGMTGTAKYIKSCIHTKQCFCIGPDKCHDTSCSLVQERIRREKNESRRYY